VTREVGYLLVRAGARLVGLPIADVVEVIEPGPSYPVPAVEPAVRGVVTVRGRILPLVHLGALLDGAACPRMAGGTGLGAVGIIVAIGGSHICLEVEAADSVLREAGMPLPPGTSLPGAVAVARHAGDLVPLLDLGILAGALGGGVTRSGVARSGVAPSVETKTVC
jgi:chemotaxis signal transduction protein